MRPLDFPLLADENIRGEVVEALVATGKQASTVRAEGLAGRPDHEILSYAHARRWVVLTHDSDFGFLAIRRGLPYTGIIYLRPGHISPAFVLETLAAVEKLPLDVSPPFLVVAHRRDKAVRVKVRTTGSDSAGEAAED